MDFFYLDPPYVGAEGASKNYSVFLFAPIFRFFLKTRMNIINESGLYNLIFRSNKPEARAFCKWVTSEVLPSIRKTGGYVLPDDSSAVAVKGTSAIAAVRNLAGKPDEKDITKASYCLHKLAAENTILKEKCRHASMWKRRAEDAERDMRKAQRLFKSLDKLTGMLWGSKNSARKVLNI
jgi:prophage antirepressor-like protein